MAYSDRSSMAYYRVAAEFVRKYQPGCGSLLDVGGGVLLGCRFLELLPEYERTSIELPRESTYSLPGVLVLQEEFMASKADQEYDVVTCLQVLEHVENPREFARKLFAFGSLVVISVPFCWPARTCEYHRHDPIDETKLNGWVGIEPTEYRVVKDDLERLVAVYATLGESR